MANTFYIHGVFVKRSALSVLTVLSFGFCGTCLAFAASDIRKNEKEDVKLTLSGKFIGAALGGILNELDDKTAGKSRNANDIYFAIPKLELQAVGEANIQPGTKAGLVARLKLGDNTPSKTFVQLDRAYAYAQGHFGQVQFGAVEGPANILHYTTPNFSGSNVDGPEMTNMPFQKDYGKEGYLARTSTYSKLSSRANKLAYYSPRVRGVQIGVAYTPDAAWQLPSLGQDSSYNLKPRTGDTYDKVTESIFNTDDPFASAKNVTEISMNYVAPINARVTLMADVFYTRGWSVHTTSSDYKPVIYLIDKAKPQEYGVGAATVYQMAPDRRLTVAGAFYMSRDIAPLTNSKVFAGADIKAWSIGVMQEIGLWSFGISYLEAFGSIEAELTDDAQKTLVSKLRNNLATVGGSYKFREGISIGAEASRFERYGLLPLKNVDLKSTGYMVATYVTVEF